MGETGWWKPKDRPLPNTPSELNCLSIKTDAGVCLCMCWGRGGFELGGNNEPWRICFSSISQRHLCGTPPHPPAMTDNPGKLPISKDNHLQVFMGAEGLGSLGRGLWNKSDRHNEVGYHVAVI